MEQSKALSKPDFRHILADINWEHGSLLVLAAKRSDSQGLLLKSVRSKHWSPEASNRQFSRRRRLTFSPRLLSDAPSPLIGDFIGDSLSQ